MITCMPFSEEPCENDLIAYLQRCSHQQQCVIILLTLGMELVNHSSYDQPLSHIRPDMAKLGVFLLLLLAKAIYRHEDRKQKE